MSGGDRTSPPALPRRPRRPTRRARLRAQRARALERPIPRRRDRPPPSHRPRHHRRRPPTRLTAPARAHQDARQLPLHATPRTRGRTTPTATRPRRTGLAYVPAPLLPEGRTAAGATLVPPATAPADPFAALGRASWRDRRRDRSRLGPRRESGGRR